MAERRMSLVTTSPAGPRFPAAARICCITSAGGGFPCPFLDGFSGGFSGTGRLLFWPGRGRAKVYHVPPRVQGEYSSQACKPQRKLRILVPNPLDRVPFQPIRGIGHCLCARSGNETPRRWLLSKEQGQSALRALVGRWPGRRHEGRKTLPLVRLARWPIPSTPHRESQGVRPEYKSSHDTRTLDQTA